MEGWIKGILLVLVVGCGVLMTFLIMLQEGKGGGLAALGGTKAAGVEGVTNPIRRATAYLAALFFILAIALGIVNRPERSGYTEQAAKALQEEADAERKKAEEEKKAEEKKAEDEKAEEEKKAKEAEKPVEGAPKADSEGKPGEPANVEGAGAAKPEGAKKDTPKEAPKDAPEDSPKDATKEAPKDATPKDATAPKEAPKAGDAKEKEAPKP